MGTAFHHTGLGLANVGLGLGPGLHPYIAKLEVAAALPMKTRRFSTCSPPFNLIALDQLKFLMSRHNTGEEQFKLGFAAVSLACSTSKSLRHAQDRHSGTAP